MPDEVVSMRTDPEVLDDAPVGGPRLADERELVRRARTDADAFAVIYRHHMPSIHAFVRRRTGSVEATEDVVAATFEKAWRSIDRFRWREPGIGPWLFRIAANEVTDHHRRRGRESSDRASSARARLGTSNAPDVEEEAVWSADRPGEAEALRAALSRLPRRYERALALRYLAGLGADEAAAAMGVAKPTMAVVTHRALSALRREMDHGRHRGDPDGA